MEVLDEVLLRVRDLEKPENSQQLNPERYIKSENFEELKNLENPVNPEKPEILKNDEKDRSLHLSDLLSS